MGQLWRRDETDPIGRELRAGRPEPPAELVERVEARIRSRSGRAYGFARVRIGLGVAVAAASLAAIGSAGAVSSAVSSVHHLAKVAERAVGSTHHGADRGHQAGHDANGHAGDPAVHHTPAHDQYHTTICHGTGHGHFAEITVPNDALAAHAAHGDIVPAPPEGCPRPSQPHH